MAPDTATYTRRSLDRNELPRLAAFVSGRTAQWMSADRALDFVTTILSGPEALIDLHRYGQRVAVGMLLDQYTTSARAAELSIILEERTADAALAATGHGVLDVILAWAQEQLVGSELANLDLPVWPGTTLPEAWLSRNGFRRAYANFEMERVQEAGKVDPPTVRLPHGLSWASYSDELFPSYYSTTCLAFESTPGVFISDGPTTRERIHRQPILPSLLVHHGGVAAFVRVELEAGGRGQIASIARHPRYRGVGLGDHLIHRGIELLSQHGVRRQHLEVSAVNTRAIDLYERWGFQCAREYVVYRRPLAVGEAF